MQPLKTSRPFLFLSALLGFLVAGVAAQDEKASLQSSSLNSCLSNSQFTAKDFSMSFWPHNGSVDIQISANSIINQYVVMQLTVEVYGYPFLDKQEFDPCDLEGLDPEMVKAMKGLCPMTPAPFEFPIYLTLDPETVSNIPPQAYTLPDLDAVVRMEIVTNDTKESLACVEADISNGKTVNLVGVKWVLAIIAGLTLCASAVLNGLGHANAAAHVASGALSLFGFFQAQAMLGLTGVHLPPVAEAWTQDFQWSMGIISVDFMQNIFTWYQRATGGTPATLLNPLLTVSVDVQKRGLNMVKRAATSLAGNLLKRDNIKTAAGSYKVFGIQRVAYMAEIESTNLYLTVITFTCLFVILTVACVAAFKGFCELATKKGWMRGDTFLDFRNGWLTVLKGILFRLTLIGYPAVVIFCLWEFTQVDSAACAVTAVFFLFGFTGTLGWASWKVVTIARRSVAMHRNPAYILFSDLQTLNKWGFLYIQFRASAYYFIIPVLGYTVVKGMFLAFAQSNGTAQAVGFLLIEGGALVAVSVMRPWMDKSTNSFNISIAVMNFLNSIFLLIFSDVFDQPPLVNGIIGLILFVVNAIFATVLLIMIIVTTILVFYRKNPDGRYQFMADDRTSFMKSQSQLVGTTELDALGASARGDKVGGYSTRNLDLDDDRASISSRSLRRQTADSNLGQSPAAQTFPSAYNTSYHNAPHSPIDPSTPMFPAQDRSPSPYDNNGNLGPNSAAGAPWQRGAGYDH